LEKGSVTVNIKSNVDPIKMPVSTSVYLDIFLSQIETDLLYTLFYR